MTTTFDNRERGYENKFAHDQEKEFKVLARTNHLLGLWAAEKIQLLADAAENYAQELVAKAVSKDSKACVKEHIHKDFEKAGLEITQQDIEAEMEKFMQIARDQVTNVG